MLLKDADTLMYKNEAGNVYESHYKDYHYLNIVIIQKI